MFDKLRLKRRNYSRKKELIYLYFLYEGLSLKKIDESLYTDYVVSGYIVQGRKFSYFDNKNYPEYDKCKFYVETARGGIQSSLEPVGLINDYLILKERPFGKTDYYFSIYNNKLGSLEYGPYSTYGLAILEQIKIKAMVMQNKDHDIRYYSDPYDKKYGYNDKIANTITKNK